MILLTIINGASAETTILADAPRTLTLDGKHFWLIPTRQQSPQQSPPTQIPEPARLGRPRKDKPPRPTRSHNDKFAQLVSILEEELVNAEGKNVNFAVLQAAAKTLYPTGGAPIGPALENLKRRKAAAKSVDGWRAL